VVSFESGNTSNFVVTIGTRDERSGKNFRIINPFPESSTLAFRKLCKDKLADVRAVFNAICSGAFLYTDTSTLDALPEDPVSGFSLSFSGLVSFAGGGNEPFNVDWNFGLETAFVPNNVGDETFVQLLEDPTFKTALIAALNQIM
jgi:hypothetical protein